MPKKLVIPADTRGPYVSHCEGVWKSHKTPDGVWRRVWRYRDDPDAFLALRLFPDGSSEHLERPRVRPLGGYVSGRNRSKPTGTALFVGFKCTAEERAYCDEQALAAGIPRSTWVRRMLGVER